MVSLIRSVPIPFRNHFHYIPCPNLYYIQKILLSVSPTSDTKKTPPAPSCSCRLYRFLSVSPRSEPRHPKTRHVSLTPSVHHHRRGDAHHPAHRFGLFCFKINNKL